jgi:periplasmic divalent cation tolerance protein
VKSRSPLLIVLVTVPNAKVARELAQAALRQRLIACANLLPGIESHFWWKGKIEKGSEVLLLLKTTKARVKALEKLILEKHPYDTPEFVVVETGFTTERYLRWAQESVESLNR